MVRYILLFYTEHEVSQSFFFQF